MLNPHLSRLLALALCLGLVVALLAIAPFYATAHAMPAVVAKSATMPGMSAHVAVAGPMAEPIPASHGIHDTACRILCFGWVNVAVPARSDGQAAVMAAVLTPATVPLFDGIAPAPGGHPPKSARIV